MLLVDLANAFNSVKRQKILEAVIRRAPHLYPWVAASLQPSRLLCGSSVILSTEGCQQGDPLGPLLFALAIQDCIEALTPSVTWHSWFLDDGTILGSLDELEQAWPSLQQALQFLGCRPNLLKCQLWGPGAAAPLPATSPLASISRVPYSDTSGLEVLGSPVHHPTSDAYALRYCIEKLAMVATLTSRTAMLPDPQLQRALLRHCADACRLMHLFKSVSWDAHPGLLGTADGSIRDCFGRLHRNDPGTECLGSSMFAPQIGGAWASSARRTLPHRCFSPPN